MTGPIVVVVLGLLVYFFVKYRVQVSVVWQTLRAKPATPPQAQTTGRPSWGWNFALLAIGLAIFYWGIYDPASWSNPGFAPMSTWIWSHWLAVGLLAGIIAAMIANNASASLKQPLFTILALVLVFLFIGVPLIAWFNEPPKPANVGRVQTVMLVREVTPLASSDPSTWPSVTIPANGQSSPIKLPIEMHHIVVKGTGGQFRLHSIYASGRDCAFGESCPDGDVTGYYVKDESGTENTVSYAFAPIGR